MSDDAVLQLAQKIADEVLFPAALSVDKADRIPHSHLDLLASEGLYGMAGPAEVAPMAVDDMGAACEVVEILASGCLTTAFVWAQHHNAVMSATHSQMPGIRDTWLEPLCAGKTRSGLALAGGVRPGTPLLRARAVDGGYLLDGEAPWVSGWSMVDVLFAAARDEQDTIVFSILDATGSDTLRAESATMVGLQASRTVQLRFDQHFVPGERVSGRMPYAMWAERDPQTLRFNGSLALGLVRTCNRLMGGGVFDAALNAAREALDSATPETMPAARAAASELALRSAAALVTQTGSRSVLVDDHAQRLVREATFLLVFGSRPGIRDALLKTFTAH